MLAEALHLIAGFDIQLGEAQRTAVGLQVTGRSSPMLTS